MLLIVMSVNGIRANCRSVSQATIDVSVNCRLATSEHSNHGKSCSPPNHVIYNNMGGSVCLGPLGTI